MLYPKPKKKKKPKRNKWGTLEEYKQVCKEVWEERDKKCEVCDVPIPELKYHNINHTKGRRHNLLNKETLELLCFTCHSNYHGIKEKNGDWLQ